MLSPAGVAAGPLLRQPGRTVVTVAMSVMLASGQIDVTKLREILVDWWDQPGLRRASSPTSSTSPTTPPEAAQMPGRRPGTPTPPVLGVKPAGALLDDPRLPPGLRAQAAGMGGVPTWWTGLTGGELAVPDPSKVSKLRRRAAPAVMQPPVPADPAVYAEAVAEVDRIARTPEEVIADG